jgi:hypothetical protein
MNAMLRLAATVLLAWATLLGTTGASAWWDDDDYYDRWDRGPWYGGHRGYPGHWGGYPGYWGGGYPGHWGGYPGYGGGKTIIVLPQNDEQPQRPQPRREPPR